MDNVTLILSGLLSLTLVILIAPNILRMNKGRVLRNVALWLAIFLGLALAYKTVGPGRSDTYQIPAGQTAAPDETETPDHPPSAPDMDKDFLPPRE